jgi:hypothetical protein
MTKIVTDRGWAGFRVMAPTASPLFVMGSCRRAPAPPVPGDTASLLPGLLAAARTDLHQQPTTSLRTRTSTMALRHGVTPLLKAARKRLIDMPEFVVIGCRLVADSKAV